jgi:hypothetical protein
MSERRRWLPQGKNDLATLAIRSVDYTINNRNSFGMQTTTDLGKWFDDFAKGPFAQLVDNYKRWENKANRTQTIIDDMNDAVKTFRNPFREFHTLIEANPLVKDSDLESMGFPRRSTGRRMPAPVADLPPGYEVIPGLGHRLKIKFFSIATERRRAKPPGQHGVEIKWNFVEATLRNNPNEFIHSTFKTSSPATLAFGSDESGRKIHLALRWENTRGEKSPWSVVETFSIP